MPSLPPPSPVPHPTRPYWLQGLPPPPRTLLAPRPAAAPRLPPAADVVIIGGGIAGVSAAYHLRKDRPELQVVLLEARQLCGGATGRNGGLLWPALNAPWLQTARRYGSGEARRIMAFELQCLAEVTAFIQDNNLQEEVRYSPFRDGALYVYESAEEMERELAELEAMQQVGIHRDATPLGASATASLLGTTAYAGAVRQAGVARVWAARLVGALARMAAEAPAAGGGGLTAVEGVRVAAVAPLPYDAPLPPAAAAALAREGGGGGAGGEGGVTVASNIVSMRRRGEAGGPPPLPALETLDPASVPLLLVTTDAGDTLLTRRVLHCTNAYGSALLPELRDALVPVRNHVAATPAPPAGASRQPLMPLDAAFYARGGYVYWSPREDGRVVVGGFRDTVPGLEWGVYDDASLDERVRGQLRSYLPAHFPGRFPGGRMEVEAEWAGILGFTQDRFPFVGPVPGRRGQFLAAGFSGHGMTRTFTCGRLLADMAAGDRPLDPGFPASWLPAPGRFGPALPWVPGPEAAAGAVYVN